MDWSRVASSYDRQLPLERTALAAAVTLAQPHVDDAWLDLGTGTGGLLRELARRRVRPRSVIGVDVCAAMLQRAQPLPEGWMLQRGDARRLPFADGVFSVVTAAYLLHVVDPATRQRILSECHRVLTAAGRLVVVTPSWPRTWFARALYAPLVAAAGSSVGPAAALRPLDPRGELEEAMFTIGASRDLRRGYPSLCVLARC
ncbi:MAG: class I SAM-dependent methyltransferase [Solirubrobacteraceae bacterium]